MIDDLGLQAQVFSNYLIKDAPCPKAVELYIKRLQKEETTITARDTRLLKLCLKHPLLVGYIDAGLALIRPYSDVRRRIFIMFAILESMPEHSNHFLPHRRNPFYIIPVIGMGLRSILRSLGGIILIKALRA